MTVVSYYRYERASIRYQVILFFFSIIKNIFYLCLIYLIKVFKFCLLSFIKLININKQKSDYLSILHLFIVYIFIKINLNIIN